MLRSPVASSASRSPSRSRATSSSIPHAGRAASRATAMRMASGSLTDGPTLLATYPSYLAQLVLAAQDLGLKPADFTLRRIDVGGEALSEALAAAARATFGVPLVADAFGMTEVLPVSGRRCAAGHLHHDPGTGLVEVLDL